MVHVACTSGIASGNWWLLSWSWCLHMFEARKSVVSLLESGCAYSWSCMQGSCGMHNPNRNRHMQVHAKLLIQVETCVHTLSSWHWPTYKNIQRENNLYYTLNNQPSKMTWKIFNQLLIDAERCRKMPGSQHAQTHADTLSALDTFKSMQPHPQPSMCADTCWNVSGSQNA